MRKMYTIRWLLGNMSTCSSTCVVETSRLTMMVNDGRSMTTNGQSWAAMAVVPILKWFITINHQMVNHDLTVMYASWVC